MNLVSKTMTSYSNRDILAALTICSKHVQQIVAVATISEISATQIDPVILRISCLLSILFSSHLTHRLDTYIAHIPSYTKSSALIPT